MNRSPHILIVEDDSEISENIKGFLSSIDPAIEVEIVTNRDAAIEFLEGDKFFDLLSLDLTIPSSENMRDRRVEYGNEVLHRCIRMASGLPILILTASSTETLVSGFLESSEQADVWGSGCNRPTVGLALKRQLDDYQNKIRDIVCAIQALSNVEVNKNPDNLSICLKDDRLIRIFARRYNATRCQISMITGGMSGARVYRISTYDSNGNLIHKVVAKMSDHESIHAETNNYNTYIKRLRRETVPRHIETNNFGAMDTASVFYELEDDYNTDYFEVARSGALSERLQINIRDMTDRWRDSSNEVSKTILELRRLLLGDDIARNLIREYKLDWADQFEKQIVQVNWCCVHGDLHGKNILINADKFTANLIDYGDIKEGPASMDPITLEFSNFFHPDGVRSSSWPNLDQAKRWFDVDEYVRGCPTPDNISFYRQWLSDVAAGRREIAASAYCYLLQQLKYRDTDKERALALLEGARNLYDET